MNNYLPPSLLPLALCLGLSSEPSRVEQDLDTALRIIDECKEKAANATKDQLFCDRDGCSYVEQTVDDKGKLASIWLRSIDTTTFSARFVSLTHEVKTPHKGTYQKIKISLNPNTNTCEVNGKEAEDVKKCTDIIIQAGEDQYNASNHPQLQNSARAQRQP